MDLTGVRSEPHVAQQSRREKLRVQQIISTQSSRTDDFYHHSDEHQNQLRSELNPDLGQVRNENSLFDLSFLPPEMIGFSSDLDALSLFHSSSHSIPSSFNFSSKVQQSSDWILNYGNNPNLIFAGEVANGSVPHPFSKPRFNHGYHFSNGHLPAQDSQKHAGESQFITPPYPMELIRSPASESGQARCSSANELATFPSFKSQEDLFRCENSSNWVDRSVENCSQQGLTLSLSSKPTSKSPASSNTCRNTGPLGPFTGYAIILKNSKFLKPAQQLLDEICGKSRLRKGKSFDLTEKASDEVSVSASVDVLDTTETTEALAKVYNSSASSSTFYVPSQTIGVKARSTEYFRPDVQQKKAKLLSIMEEVCRKYRQYNQQMQMVVSSFESVAGLGLATPFMSFAEKTVSRHFRCLKNVISEQLRHVRRALGEELLSQISDEQSLEKFSNGVGGFGLIQPHQHGWRPQRGLPERAVAILRAWLFEHFLHPYPTDVDKHMLATQTGLSRNQVSNWFINARVRVWKPMVEEIHKLETKGLNEANKSDNQKNNTESCGRVRAAVDPGTSHEKRSRLESEASPSRFDGAVVGFLPYQHGDVSLTLGLRHGVENSQLTTHCGRDFVG